MRLLGGALEGLWPKMMLAVSLLSGGGPDAVRAQAVARTHVLIITGSSGEPRFATRFHAQAMAMRGVARSGFGISDSLIAYLAENQAVDPKAITGRSTREGITHAINAISGRASPGDVVFLLLIGHGTADGDVSRFNVPGQDISDADFAVHLSKLARQTVVLVIASSASGDFVKSLSSKGRVVITATKSGFERNETLFGEHFVAAYAGGGADSDKDGRVSLLEAFTYARREVARAYETTNRLQTEHAMLDDDGDGAGKADPGEGGTDGMLARGIYLQPVVTPGSSIASDPRAAALLATEARLQAQLDSLRLVKSAMPESEYERRLEELLVRLSETAASLRALGVRKP